jgi:hypothetical protein
LKLRYFDKDDQGAIERFHKAQGFDYKLPDFSQPEFLVRAVIERPDGSPALALFLRKTAEAYMLHDPNEDSRKERVQQLLVLHREIPPLAQQWGIGDLHCMLPPAIEGPFGKLLLHLGWTKPDWAMYARKVR